MDGKEGQLYGRGRTRARDLLRTIAVVALAALGLAQPARADALDATAAAASITGYFQNAVDETGNVVDPVSGLGAQRYSQAMLGYSALRVAAHTGDQGQRAFGLGMLDFVAAHPESHQQPSVFEIGAAAAAYNALAETPAEPARRRLATWLAVAPRVFVADDGLYHGNKYVVEAYALLELCHAGAAVRGDAPALCRRARRLVAGGLPAAAARYTTRDDRGRPVVVLSDPPDNPIAYHQLVTAYLARSLRLMPPSRATSRLLVAMARGVEALAGPDGDVAYWGRSQEEGWSLLLGAYGLREAARFAGAAEARSFRSTAGRLLVRFRGRHVGGPYGTYITPAFAADPFARPAGVDGYVNASTYAGLTAFALSWLADQGSPSAGVAATRSPGARAPAFTHPRGSGAFATVRRKRVWFAVRQHRKPPAGDLRYDFGLVAAKVLAADGWRDVLPVKPMTGGAPDSAGPLLFARGRVGYPDGDRLAVARDGTVRAVGGWRDASGRWLRRGTFVFRPEPGGVQESFPVRRGDRIEYSAFAVAPQLVGRRLVDGARRTTFSLPVGARIEPGYSSAEHRQLARVRLTVGAPAAGRLRILHAIGRAGHPRQLWVRAARRPPTARGEPLAD